LPLKTYNRHLVLGFAASGGSLYFNSTPFTVFVSAANLPDNPKLGSIFCIGSSSSLTLSSGLPHSNFLFPLLLGSLLLRLGGGERERLLNGERERLDGGERERLDGGERERLDGGERE
jgi:hypothetical protein